MLGLGGYIVYDKIISNKDMDTKETNNNSNNKTDNTESVNTKEKSTLTGKINFNDYCPKIGDCKKDIGNINLNCKNRHILHVNANQYFFILSLVGKILYL